MGSIYLADLVIRILVEREGAVEGLQDLATHAHLLVPGFLLLLLLAEELRGDPGRDDRPRWPPSDVPASSMPALADANSAMCAAALTAAAGSMSIESPYSSLLSGSSTKMRTTRSAR